MSSCEKCWRDAHADFPYTDVSEEYGRLMSERKDNPCTPEEQAGEFSETCADCDRKTVHQATGECMACHRQFGPPWKKQYQKEGAK